MNVVWNGDCLRLLKSLESESINMVFTSPPYANQRKDSYGGIKESEYIKWFTPIAQEIKRVLKPSGSFFLNIKPHSKKGERSLYVFDLVCAIKRECGFRYVDEFTWTKLGVPGKFKGKFKNAFEPIYHFTKSEDWTFNPYAVATKASEASMARYGRTLSGDSKNGSGFGSMRKEITTDLALPSNHIHMTQKSNQHTIQKFHPAVFPVELVDFFVKAFTNPGDVILDPFAGYGTVAVSCINLQRNYVLMEQNSFYCEKINHRLMLIDFYEFLDF